MPTSNAPPHPPDIAALLAAQPAFSALSAQQRKSLAAQWQIRPMAAGEPLVAAGDLPTQLGMVVGGFVVLQDPDLERTVRLASGALFGFGATPLQHLNTWQAMAATEGSVAWLTPKALQQICAAQPELEYHFASLPSQSVLLSSPMVDDGAPLNRLATPLRALIKRPPVCLSPETPVQSVAEHMRSERVSSVLF